MAIVEKRGNSYRITVSNGYDVTGKQIREKTTFTPNPDLITKYRTEQLEYKMSIGDQWQGITMYSFNQMANKCILLLHMELSRT